MSVSDHFKLAFAAVTIPLAALFAKRWSQKSTKAAVIQSAIQVISEPKTQPKPVPTLKPDRASVPCLGQYLHGKIYGFLDPKSQTEYGKVCRALYLFFKHERPYILKLEKFIHENYQVIAGHSSKTDIHRVLSHEPVLGLVHDPDSSHMVLNATLMNQLLLSDSNPIFIQGTERALDNDRWPQWKILHYLDPIKYLPLVQWWDTDAVAFDVSLIVSGFEHNEKLLKATQQLYRLYSNKEEWTIDRLCAILSSLGSSSDSDTFWSSLPNSKGIDLQEYFRGLEKDVDRKEEVLKYLKHFALMHILKIEQRQNEIFRADYELLESSRSSFLGRKILNTLKNINGRTTSVFLARKKHILEQNARLKAGFCLFLQPRPTLTAESIHLSQQRIFKDQAKPLVFPLESAHAEAESSPARTALDLESQVKELLAFDGPRSIVFADDCTAWKKRSLQIINSELALETRASCRAAEGSIAKDELEVSKSKNQEQMATQPGEKLVSTTDKILEPSPIASSGAQVKEHRLETSSVTATIHNLSLVQLSQICDFLDPVSRSRFGRSCFMFNNIAVDCVHIAKLEEFIRDNFEIIGGDPSRMGIRKFFYNRSIWALGETHSMMHHQLLNALLVNHMWNPEVSVFLEGGKRSLQISKKMVPAGDILQHLRPEIAISAQTWDLDLAEVNSCLGHFCAEQETRSTGAVFSVQELFQLYSDEEHWSVDQFKDMLEKTVSVNAFNGFWDRSPIWSVKNIKFPDLLERLKKFEQVPIHRKAVMDLLKLVVIDCHMYLDDSKKNRDLVYYLLESQLRFFRDKRLSYLALDESFRRSIFIFAGKKHVITLDRKLKGYSFPVDYLCLEPRSGISVDSILQSDQRIFGKVSAQTEPSAAKPVIEEGFSLEKSSSHDEQIKQLLGLTSLNYSSNYHSLWQIRARELLVTERDRISKNQEQIDAVLNLVTQRD